MLRKVVQGYYPYHAVPGNTGQLRLFRRRSATPNGVVGITCLLQRIGGLWGSYFAVVFCNRFRNYLCAAVLTRLLTRLLD